METLSLIADICGVFSLVFAFAIWRSAKNIKEQLNVYKRNQKDIVVRLMANRENLYQDGLYAINIRSSLRTELFSIQKNYSSLLSVRERAVIRATLSTLQKTKPSEVNIEKLCVRLDYIIARFNKKESAK